MSHTAGAPTFVSDDSSSAEGRNSCFISSIWIKFSRLNSDDFVTKQEATDTINLALGTGNTWSVDLAEQVFKSFIDCQRLFSEKDGRYRVARSPPQGSMQGVFVSLSDCYAPRCKKGTPCYAWTCPNNENPGQPPAPRSDNDMLQTVPKGISKTTFLQLAPIERKRQSAIAEIVASEQQYYQDIDVLHRVYALPLLSDASIIEHARRKKFHRAVFCNYRTIQRLHSQAYQELLENQDPTSHLFGDHVGATIYNHVSRLMDPYVTYAANHVQAMYVITFESNRSTRFEQFLEAQDANGSTRRLGLRHYLTLPTFRICKYILLVQTLYKYTTNEGDQLTLGAAIAELRDILDRMNEAAHYSELQTRRLRVASTLLIPSHIPTTIERILPDQAVLLHEGRLLLARSLRSFIAIPCHVLLFTHLVVVTRPRVSGKHEEFEVVCAPIPLHMLRIDRPRHSSGSMKSISSSSGSSSGSGGSMRMMLVHNTSSEDSNESRSGFHIRSRLSRFRHSLRHRKVAVQQEQEQQQQQQQQ
ncbi:Dbl homology domain-containing protein, partial [Dichotomocladium elegans]